VSVNVVLTREAGHNDVERAWLPDDANVVEVPLTATKYFSLEDVARDLEACVYRGSFRALVVTSARAADYVSVARGSLAPGAQILVVGPATARALADRGIGVTALAPSRAVEIADSISSGPVLQLGASEMRDELATELAARHIATERVACYETLPLELDGIDRAVLASADVVLIGAPSAWSVARAYVGPDAWVVVPGATTAAAVRAHHVRVLENWGPQLRATLAALSSWTPEAHPGSGAEPSPGGAADT
jgi:uroporphyrinogen-III synthase